VSESVFATSVGTLLNGTYRLERVIAEGGMGVVYEAQHVRLPRRFAVKILGKPLTNDSDAAATTLARFRREAEIASTLAHPHIVEVFDYQVSESGAPYLVMELLEGEDLADRVKRGRIGVAAAVRVIGEIAEALDVAHAAGVVHRDLKPANVFLCKRGGREDFVKVLDFGVSKLVDSATLTQEKAMVGTPLYMSPEQAVGKQELTPESDVFSLGAISYEILTGRRAFAASSIPSILYHIVHGRTPKLAGRAPGLSVAADLVFARVLAKKKEDRYKRASQFAEELRQALERSSPSSEVGTLGEDPLILVDDGAKDTASPVGEVTALDSSTNAGAELPKPASSASTEIPKASLASLASASEVEDLRPRSRAAVTLTLVGVAFLGVVGAVVYSARKTSPNADPVAAAAPAATAPASATGATPTTAPTPGEPAATAKVDVFEPEPVKLHAPVQFIFHVVPPFAEVYVDDKKIDGNKLTLPYQTVAHRVIVRANGYHTLTTSASSTANRTFELRMERAWQRTRQVAPVRDKPVHDAPPVQDL
jgi:serine/threonine-protein kinase